MTHEEKIKYMTIAVNICGFGMREKHIDHLVQTYELVLEKKGNADMMDIAKIQAGLEGKYPDKLKDTEESI